MHDFLRTNVKTNNYDFKARIQIFTNEAMDRMAWKLDNLQKEQRIKKQKE